MDAKRENMFNRIYLNKTAVAPDKENGELTTFYHKEVSLEKPRHLYFTNVLPYHMPGKVVYYDFDATTSLLNVKVLDIPTQL